MRFLTVKQSEYLIRNFSKTQLVSLSHFIPIRCAIGIHSTYRFQFTSFLKSEFHEKSRELSGFCNFHYFNFLKIDFFSCFGLFNFIL